MPLQLSHFTHLPRELADIDVRDIRQVFPEPALIHLKGEIEPPLFVSTLLHGNETTSFHVLRHLQKRAAQGVLKRSLMIFVGNVRAAEEGLRHLDGQPDFNRIWAHGDTPHHHLASQVLDEARRLGVFASIDVHNNTGANPVYGCISSLRAEDLYLAAQFAPLGVYYLNPPTTQSIAFSHICPAITLECAQSGHAGGLKAAIDLVDHVMELDAFPTQPPKADALQLFETVGRVLIDPAIEPSFGPAPGAGLQLREDLERLNFTEIAAGMEWASVTGLGLGMRVVDEHQRDLTDEFFFRQGQKVILRQDIVPAMVTRDQNIIRQDCLCYLMKPLGLMPTGGN